MVGQPTAPTVHRIVLGQSNRVTVNDDAGSPMILHRSYLDQDADCSRSLVGNVVPEGELADGARLLPNRAPHVSFVTSETQWGSFQRDKMS